MTIKGTAGHVELSVNRVEQEACKRLIVLATESKHIRYLTS